MTKQDFKNIYSFYRKNLRTEHKNGLTAFRGALDLNTHLKGIYLSADRVRPVSIKVYLYKADNGK